MLVLAFGVAIFDKHTRLTNLETDAPLLLHSAQQLVVIGTGGSLGVVLNSASKREAKDVNLPRYHDEVGWGRRNGGHRIFFVRRIQSSIIHTSY